MNPELFNALIKRLDKIDKAVERIEEIIQCIQEAASIRETKYNLKQAEIRMKASRNAASRKGGSQ